MMPAIEKISAVTLRVMNMTQSVRFYRDVLGSVSSLRCQASTCFRIGSKFRSGLRLLRRCEIKDGRLP